MLEDNSIKISEELIEEIAVAEASFCRKVRKCDPMKSVNSLVSGYNGIVILLVKNIEEEKLNKARILEIGSGKGFSLCYAIKQGLDITGIEPGKTFGFCGRYERAIKLLKLNDVRDPEARLIDAVGEKLPFEGNNFDIVICIAVLEHVKDLDSTMQESIRVLKPDGVLIANVPNYNSFYEGYYNIFWLPLMSKRLAKSYVKIFGRDPDFIGELLFTKPSLFRKYLESDLVRGKLYFGGKGKILRQ